MLVSSNPGSWANSDFDKCKNITITNVGSTTLTDFPVYVNLTKDNDMLSNHHDLRFYNSSCNNGGSLLNYEIENYTSAKADIWVKTSLSSGSNIISVYYDNNTAISSGENATGVWDSDFIAVWHFGEGSGTTILDSTSNSNDGTFKGAGEPAWAIGKVGNAVNFDGADDFINVSDSVSLDTLTGDMTVEAFVYEDISSGASGHPLIYKGSGANVYGIFTFGEYNDDGGFVGFNQANKLIDTTGGILQNVWQQWAFVHDAGTSLVWYVNAIQDADTGTNVASIDTDNYDLQLGRWYGFADASRYFDGKFDELRISKSVRSSDWINQSYQIVENQGTYVVFGSEEEAPPIDTCSCPSPASDWNVDCSDNCVITSDCTISDNILNLYGTGTFTILANITVDKVIKENTCQMINKINDGNRLIVKLG